MSNHHDEACRICEGIALHLDQNQRRIDDLTAKLEVAEVELSQRRPKDRIYPCGCIHCVCTDNEENRCYGCGARNCGQPGLVEEHVPKGPRISLPSLVNKLASYQAALAEDQAEGISLQLWWRRGDIVPEVSREIVVEFLADRRRVAEGD